MYIRFDKNTLILKHISVPAFTVAATADEADAQIPDVKIGYAPETYRVKPDLSGIEYDVSLDVGLVAEQEQRAKIDALKVDTVKSVTVQDLIDLGLL